MRVTLVTETYLPQVNGVSRTLSQLVRVLRDAGDDVQVVHPDYGSAAASENDVLVRSEEIPFYREVRLPMPPFGRVHDAIARFAPQIVHIATEATLGLSILRLALREKMPVVSSFHTNFDQYTDHYRVGWLKRGVWRYLRWFHNQTRETYVPSRASIQTLERRGFERLVLWPRGVDCSLFRPDRPDREALRSRLGFQPEHVVVGHVSRIAVEKNVDYLAAALERLIAIHGDQVRILIVGDGPERAELETRLGPAARCVGFKTGPELADHYAACDLFAFASVTETFGNVILEAMASGLPVVALRAGGPAEIVVDGETGILLSPSDSPETMSNALSSLVTDKPMRIRMSQAARAHAERQTWHAIMTALRTRYLAQLVPTEGSLRESEPQRHQA